MNGCELHLGPLLHAIPLALPQPRLLVPLTIPTDPLVTGVGVFVQAVVGMPTQTILPVTTSNAVSLRIEAN